MLSLIVGAGSFHRRRRANAGSKPNTPSMMLPATDRLNVIATTSIVSTHAADTVIFMC